MPSSILEDQNYNWWENHWEPETEENQDIQDIQDIQDNQKAVAASGTHAYQGTDHVAFNKQLSRLVFTYIQVAVSSGCYHGVLVSVLGDFLVLVNGCLITEIPFKEIEALQFRARGCPCKKTKKMPQKTKKNFSKKKSPIGFRVTDKYFSPELLRGLFAR